MKRFLLFALCPIAIIILVACNSREQYRAEKYAHENNELQAEKSSQKTEEVPLVLSEEETQVPHKINDLAFTFFNQVRATQNEKSFVLSPLSLAYIMGIVSNGASGKTLNEFVRTIGDTKVANSFFSKYLKSLPNHDNSQVEILNYVAVNEKCQLKNEFVDSVAAYKASVQSLDFDDTHASEQIQNWFRQNAHGYVPILVEETDPMDLMYLINYLHFKAEWAVPFPEDETQLMDFHQDNGKKVRVQLMNNQWAVPYYEDAGFQSISMNYAGTPYHMLIVLPKGQRLNRLAKSMAKKTFERVLDGLKRHYVDVSFPKFSTENELNVLNLIQRLIPTSVDMRADFSRLCVHKSYISDVKQNVKIEVSERKTEATAATVANNRTLSEKPPLPKMKFIADHPFLYFIYDDISRTILFMGQYCGN